MSENNLAKIGEAFFEIERRENLYDWRIAGISVWVLMRSRLFRVLTQNSELYDWQTAKKFELPAGAKPYADRNSAKLLWKAALGKPQGKRSPNEPDFSDLAGFDAIVVPFATRSEENPQFEKFSQPIVDALSSKALVFGVGQWDKLSNRPRLEDLNAIFIGRYGFAASIFVRLAVRQKDYAKYRRIVSFLEETTGATMRPYDQFPRWILRSFVAERFGFRKIIKKTNAKTMFMVNAARMSLQAAAQSLGVKVVEIQSGVFSKYSLQFSWPGSPEVSYLPNEIWTWGEYFTAGIEHASNQTIRVIGSTEEFDSVRKAHIVRKSNQVVFLTQPLVGNEILRVAIEFAKLKPDMHVVVKMHPRNSFEEFQKIIDASSFSASNFEMVQSERSSLELIAESEVAVGAFSTALIEAAGLGTKVAILRLPGWEHLTPMVERGYAKVFDGAQQLAEGLHSLEFPADIYFFYGHKADIASLARLG